MNELVKGSVSHSVEPYIDLLRSEPFFKKSRDLEIVIFNFITVAVHDGKFFCVSRTHAAPRRAAPLTCNPFHFNYNAERSGAARCDASD